MIIPALPVLVPTLVTAMGQGGLLNSDNFNSGAPGSAISDSAALTSNTTLINRYNAQSILATGNYVRVIMVGPGTPGTTTTVSNTWIGKPATSGDAYDFLSGNPVRVTWDGSNSLTLQAGNIYTSDVIAYSLEDGPLLIAMDVTSGSVVRYRSGLLSSAWGVYYKTATTEAGTVDKSAGYTAIGGYSYLVTTIETGG